ncbi:hypothetical protein Sjap_010867 [Stephania japonica]|uniref:Uncharacterized protein n=1 Tax=Stephania japonica TaxID=461633 RepID=A0AAP0JC31_9MAGN
MTNHRLLQPQKILTLVQAFISIVWGFGDDSLTSASTTVVIAPLIRPSPIFPSSTFFHHDEDDEMRSRPHSMKAIDQRRRVANGGEQQVVVTFNDDNLD